MPVSCQEIPFGAKVWGILIQNGNFSSLPTLLYPEVNFLRISTLAKKIPHLENLGDKMTN